jgi:hypothetical protein
VGGYVALTGTETYGTVVPGFVTDGDGVLSTASVIDATERGFKVDADGRLVTTETADGTELGTVVPGFLTNADGALVVTTSATGAVFGEVVAGFWTSATGALIVEEKPHYRFRGKEGSYGTHRATWGSTQAT